MSEMTYRQAGDYQIPNIKLKNTETKPLGKYGRMRRAFLQENNPMLLNDLILSEQLFPHLQEVQRTAGAAGIEHHDLTIRQGAVAALGDHAVRERGGNDHDEVYAGNGFRHIAGHFVQALMRGLAVERQVDAVSGNDALKVLREQVTQIDLDAEAGKICGNGRTAVAGANDSNFFFHFVFASENVSLGRVLHSRSTRQFLLCQRDDYLCCILKSFFQKNRRSTTRIAREMPQAMKPNFIAPMLVIRKGHMEVTRPPPMKGLIRGPSSA